MDWNTSRDVLVAEHLGYRVTQSAMALPATTTTSIFLVTGGMVHVTLMIGQVSTAIQSSDPIISITSRATTGSAVVLNSTADTSSLEVGASIRVDGSGNAIVLSNAGACLSTAFPSGFVVPIGNIAIITGATKTGAINWDLWYIPLTDGAAVVAA